MKATARYLSTYVDNTLIHNSILADLIREVCEENHKVREFFKRHAPKDALPVKDSDKKRLDDCWIVQEYDHNFPDHLKHSLNELILVKYKRHNRDSQIDSLLDEKS